jgi:hypothetical protein
MIVYSTSKEILSAEFLTLRRGLIFVVALRESINIENSRVELVRRIIVYRYRIKKAQMLTGAPVTELLPETNKTVSNRCRVNFEEVFKRIGGQLRV